MNKSLQDQLLGAGLVDGKKAKKIAKESRKTKNENRRKKAPQVSESQQNAQRAIEEKKARDKALNQVRQAEADKRALAAQVKQMVEQYRVTNARGDTPYNFNDGGTVKRLHLKEASIDEVVRGRLCVAKVGDRYELIPKPVADKIKERDESVILVYNFNQSKAKSEDTSTDVDDDSDEAYYAQFEIPDDLNW